MKDYCLIVLLTSLILVFVVMVVANILPANAAESPHLQETPTPLFRSYLPMVVKQASPLFLDPLDLTYLNFT